MCHMTEPVKDRFMVVILAMPQKILIREASGSIILWVNELLGGDEDTIQEFSLILLLDSADTSDLGAAEGDGSVVDTLENDLILHVLGGGELNSASWLHLDEVRFLSTQEVLDLNLLLVLGHKGSDGEMCVNHLHFVSVAL